MISGSMFIDAFKEVWSERLENWGDELMAAWSPSPWTAYMMRHDGVIADVGRRLASHVPSLEYSTEVYTVDAMFVGGRDLYQERLCYPSTILTLIEHEQGMHPEEEMWKLIFWRSPLKVLIMYDWDDVEVTKSDRDNWLYQKLSKLTDMLNTSNHDHGVDRESEYLFLVGKMNNEKSILWRYSSTNLLGLQSLQPVFDDH